jgi:hypothetical protein
MRWWRPERGDAAPLVASDPSNHLELAAIVDSLAEPYEDEFERLDTQIAIRSARKLLAPYAKAQP